MPRFRHPERFLTGLLFLWHKSRELPFRHAERRDVATELRNPRVLFGHSDRQLEQETFGFSEGYRLGQVSVETCLL
jgi:hypothetical protein